VAVSRRTARPRFTLLLLILTAATLLTIDARGSGSSFVGTVRGVARDAFAPVQGAFDAVFEPIGNVVQGVLHYGDLEDENARLRDENAELRSRALQAADADQERRALLDLQGLDFVGDIPTVPARVVNTAPSNYEETIEIDRGTSHGVAVDMPVVGPGGLVGRIVETSSTRAVVLLITDPDASVGVRLGSGEVGVAQGQAGRDQLTVGHVPPGTEVAKGEVAVTSGLQQSFYPPSIPVGIVTRATNRPGALNLDIRLRPAADLDRLTFVKVLQWSSQG
jgi:rod shape-determining protein MreC